MKTTAIAVALTVAWMFGLPTAWASGDKDHAELAKALKDAKIPLQRGLAASGTKWKRPSAALAPVLRRLPEENGHPLHR